MLLRKYGLTRQKTLLFPRIARLRADSQKHSFLASQPCIPGWVYIWHWTLKTWRTFLKAKDGWMLPLVGAKLHVRYFSKPPSRFRAGRIWPLCHFCNDPWPALLPLKEDREQWRPLPPCKAALKSCEHWVFMNFEKGTMGTKTLLFVLTNCLLWWIKYRGCNPRIPSGAGTDSPPDLLQATFSRVPMTYEESRDQEVGHLSKGSWSLWVRLPGIGLHCWPGLRAVTHYWFHIFLAYGSTFPFKALLLRKALSE